MLAGCLVLHELDAFDIAGEADSRNGSSGNPARSLLLLGNGFAPRIRFDFKADSHKLTCHFCILAHPKLDPIHRHA